MAQSANRAAANPADANVFQYELPPLPYAEDALAPVMSAETLRFHHGKHHKKYVDTMNQMLREQPVPARTLEDVVKASSGKLFNNAAQAWNHTFFWQCLSPKDNQPPAALRGLIEKDFNSLDHFRTDLAKAASGQFGSGWAWLIRRAGKLEIVTTPNAETPMAKGIECLLTIDVWEHAYYIDYRNDRDKYLAELIGKRINWAFVEENLEAK
jgi:superoxide dismutase, Fe-Mn family